MSLAKLTPYLGCDVSGLEEHTQLRYAVVKGHQSWPVTFYLYSVCSPRLILCVLSLIGLSSPHREGSLKVGDRLLSIDGIPLHGASHATAIATLQQCSHEALFQVEYDVATPGTFRSEGKGWGKKRSQVLSTIKTV